MLDIKQGTRWPSRQGSLSVYAVLAMLLLGFAVALPAHAQLGGLPPPQYTVMDESSVDLLSFNVRFDIPDLSIGSKEHPLIHTLISGPEGDTLYSSQGIRDSLTTFLSIPARITPQVCADRYVTVGSQMERFNNALCGDPAITIASGTTGDTLSNTGIYTMHDGTRALFGAPIGLSNVMKVASQLVYPDGRTLTYYLCADASVGRWCSIVRNDGLQLKYSYVLVNAVPVMTSVAAINNAYEYCDPTASACTLTKAWPTVSYASSSLVNPSDTLTVTDAEGRRTRLTVDAIGRIVGIKYPSSATVDNVTYSYCDTSPNWCSKFFVPNHLELGGSTGFVQSVTRDGHTWTYVGDPGAATSNPLGQCAPATYSATSPTGGVQTASVYYCFPQLPNSPPQVSPTNSPLLQITGLDGTVYSTGSTTRNAGLVRVVTKPEGDQIQYAWDSRSNITQESHIAKPGSGLPSIAMSAGYDATCASPVKCNKPNWVKDGLGNQTDYTYDPVHGGVLTVTLPPDAHGIRPQTRSTYAQRYAWVLNASGAYVKSAAPIWILAMESSCRTSAASPSGSGCIVAGDEVVKTYEYGPDAGPNNLFLRGISIAADGVTHRTCYANDRLGNRISETEPNAALMNCP